ncbi:hypothetical protein VNO78_24382 [Psophocarpus tetragonolobus]|uniref:Uncharacterized protein n=1 Tax=Psophocarpus tetragonolobus TaxID=3891 RepID=A0AAN9S4D6_PSOTE
MIGGDDQRKISQGGPEEEGRAGLRSIGPPLRIYGRKGFRLAWFMSIDEGSQITLDRRLVAWVRILHLRKDKGEGVLERGNPRLRGQEGSINRLICKAKKSKNLLCLSLSYEPVIEQEFDWIETRGAYTSKVSLAQQFLETKAKVLFRSQGVHYLLLLAIPMPMPMRERFGEYTDREERDRKHKVASEASGESNERVRIGPITLTQGESIAWFPTGRKGLGLDVNCKMKRKL